ncbi:staphylopine uptake ABC transporter ATP-binding protein CntD [Clostridium formicaceticum]|uniref:Nickel import ATP-binding protein NikD n=1 Tax=Clostridium formicaceticum TaxID=1497 RepID=A0AAC9WHN1_9CLOT|nr:ABC transporter ATP-binding protein [Clostridium formicaceticum]AOY74586.1 nickel import ATP-binding protein NikD [Clostridium formicaceticum]ARE88949.1 Oligopeptide transport ATP-binding protein OppD [Clostridium formicaceticum]
MVLLEVKNLKVWDTRNNEVIIKNNSFSVKENRCLAIVGESGSGKSMTCKSIMRLNKPWIEASGNVLFKGKDIFNLPNTKMRKLCGKNIAMIMQNGMSAFDPSSTIGVHLRETLWEHYGWDKKHADEAMVQSMESIMLKNPKEILKKYPHQLSGGMLQRIMIALTLVLEPDVIIADEPTTALDTITQFEVIHQFVSLRKRTKSSMIFISHDLGVVKKIADDVIVMQDGCIVESGTLSEIFKNPKNNYTRYLISTREELGNKYKKMLGGGIGC